ncbi:MAG: HNH endonuclease [Burkholderiaceae bacterium]
MITNDQSLFSEQEIWKPIPWHPKYEISNLGRVRRGPKLRVQQLTAKGYPRVSFWIDGKALKALVHSIVAEVFIGPRPSGLVLRHKNGNPADARAANLVYGTNEENEADKDLHGTKVNGTKHHSNKLSEEQVREIRKRYTPRDPKNHLRALSAEFGVSPKTVQRIVLRAIWKHVD